jgi:hypothetical protein
MEHIMSYHYPQFVGTIPQPRPNQARVSQLLRRYPRITDDETREIVAFMRNGRHLDIGLLTSDDEIRPQLDAFMADHKADFRVRWGEGVAVIGSIAAVLTALWLVSA